jgi:uncharacterized protein YyaL (SSP411 family)
VSRQLLDLFWDDESGGFFTTGDDAEALIVRPKEFSTGRCRPPTPSPSHALLRASALDDDPGMRRGHRAHRGLAGPLLTRHPGALADLVAALPMDGRQEIVVTGDRPDLLAEVRRHWLPDAVVAWGEPDGSPLFADRPARSAFVCRGFACAAPADARRPDPGRAARGLPR